MFLMRKLVLTGMMTAFIFSTAALSASAASTYEVRAGDNLYRIAIAHNVTVDEIKKWNSLTSDSLSVNQQLQIGGAPAEAAPKKEQPAAATSTQASAAPATAAAEPNVYRVQKGDSLYKIGQRFGMSINDLKSINSLTSDRIFVNQALKVSGAAKGEAKETATSIKAPGMAVSAKPLASGSEQFYANAVAIAMPLQGTKYSFGGSTPAGFDCSGFIHYVYSKAGLSFGRTSSAGMFNASTEVTNPAFGDLVFFENTYTSGISHAGIFIGNNSFIHAGSKGVEITRLDNPYWQKHFVSFKRLNAVSSLK